MEQSSTFIVLTTQTRIIHRVHVYYMIKMFEVFLSLSSVLYGSPRYTESLFILTGFTHFMPYFILSLR